ncbi:MAG TPA: hypothetical protein VGC50_16800 [Gammaproteobacteria bacterium]|jgi:hypothetical protein
MQRIAVLFLCAGFWTSSVSAETCDTVGDIVGGFAAGATSYALINNVGATTNWVSAGLYGAGITVATLGGNAAGEAACENFRDIIYTIADIHCIAGEYICDFVSDLSWSIAGDFMICPSCRPDEIFSAFLMEDVARAEHLRRIQQSRRWRLGVSMSTPRDHLGQLRPSVLNSYFVGQQTALSLMRTRTMAVMPR